MDNKTEKVIIFDSGALISFSMNGIVYLIKNLKKVFSGKFIITSEVKREVIDVPLKIKKFELEALKIKQLLNENILELPSSIGIKDSEVSEKTVSFMDKANNLFNEKGRNLKIIDNGEASCLALGRILNEKGIKNLIVIDERTARVLVESPENLRNFLEKKLRVKISLNKDNSKFFKGLNIIRSAEIVYIAYKKGVVEIKDELILDALLYAVKFKGAAISGDEIEEIKRIAKKTKG